MADTRRTLAALLTLFANNTTGQIGAQDLRDFVVSSHPAHGEIDITVAAETTINTVNVWENSAGTFTLAEGTDFDMNSNGQLRYTGPSTEQVDVNVHISMTAAANNKIWDVGVGLNGTIVPYSFSRHKVSTGADISSVASSVILTMVTNDYLTIMVRNTTDDTNATVELGGLDAFSFFT
jgi:hypothetical protein